MSRTTDPTESAAFEPDPVIEAYKRDVDVTLLIDNLRRSARDRLELMVARLELMEELRRTGPRPRTAR
jgi:hypothetical protein